MKVVEPGHIYQLRLLDESPSRINPHDTLRFVKRVGEKYPGNEYPRHPGTICQEVLRALIDRAEYLNKQIPCAKTEAAIGNLRSALLLFEIRAARVHNRTLGFSCLKEFEEAIPCNHCLHVGCPIGE